MFVHMKKIPAKTADALDLIIEFATLGEYGLEYPERDHRTVTGPCDESRRHIVVDRNRSALTRLQPRGMAHLRSAPPSAAKCPADYLRGESNHKGPVTPPAGNPAFASALRPPRIKLSFTE
jgi:hypothetical protein